VGPFRLSLCAGQRTILQRGQRVLLGGGQRHLSSPLRPPPGNPLRTVLKAHFYWKGVGEGVPGDSCGLWRDIFCTVLSIKGKLAGDVGCRNRISSLFLLKTELEFLKRLWGLGTGEEEGYCTGPPGYIGWRNSFLGIDSGAPYTFKNTSSGFHTFHLEYTFFMSGRQKKKIFWSFII
jgi:hypothetical protein